MVKEIQTARLSQDRKGAFPEGREEGRAFQREGLMVARDLVWVMVILTRGTKRTCQ